MKAATWCLIVVVVAWSQQLAQAQFTTIIDVPPQSAPLSIGSDTQLNLLDGGLLGEFFSAGAADGTSTNIEVNILGGGVGSEFGANGGATVNISGGYVSSGFDANNGSIVNITGGVVAQSLHATGSQVNISGGSVDDGARAFLGSVVNISGGMVGDDFIAEDGGTLMSRAAVWAPIRRQSRKHRAHFRRNRRRRTQYRGWAASSISRAATSVGISTLKAW